MRLHISQFNAERWANDLSMCFQIHKIGEGKSTYFTSDTARVHNHVGRVDWDQEEIYETPRGQNENTPVQGRNGT